MLQELLAQLEPDHAAALLWFLEHEGEIGVRPWRRHGHSIVEGVDVPLVAQRGIHRPSGWDVALSVTATATSAYMDGQATDLGDGTWALPYRAHSGNDGHGESSRWNQALVNNGMQRIPVGVFVPAPHAKYMNLGLAMVEDYYPDQSSFLLRGPVRLNQDGALWNHSPSSEVAADGREQVTEPRLMPAFVRQRIHQDRFRDALLDAYDHRCAITGYVADAALQAAHILAYSGLSSQSVNNGLLLRADLHLLYDRHLLTVSPNDLHVVLAPALRSSSYGRLDGTELRPPQMASHRPDRDRLAVHFSVFQESHA